MNLAPSGPDTLSSIAGGNWFRKHQYALSQQWLRALAATHSDGSGLTPAQLDARQFLTDIIGQDRELFGGWYRRHGGEITFLGDSLGASDLTSVLLLAGYCILLWKMARYLPPPPAPAHKPAPKAAVAHRKR
ncbi:MAG TPA: hypothetical protein VMH28_20220 [Candidatus Acidoferrales bacterium]|nr:hypothetical protein [Candidatus Acidoferrales bacterium]